MSDCDRDYRWLPTSSSANLQVTLDNTTQALKDLTGQMLALSDAMDPPCCVCGQRTPGLAALPDGTPVHRWPCRERLL